MSARATPTSSPAYSRTDSPRPVKEQNLTDARSRLATLEKQRRATESKLFEISRELGRKSSIIESLQQRISSYARDAEQLRLEKAQTNVLRSKLARDYRSQAAQVEKLEEALAKDTRRREWDNN